MAKVLKNEVNIRHCRCPVCPVQQNSACAKEKLSHSTAEEDAAKPPEELAELYCGIGKSACNDIDGNKACLCPSCLVWEDDNLKSNHYCVSGSADEID